MTADARKLADRIEAAIDPEHCQYGPSEHFSTTDSVSRIIVSLPASEWRVVIKALRADPVYVSVPEGCTPADAALLREGNAVLAEENHNLRRCLRFYANGEHYTGLLHWEGPSGDDNWLCPPSSETGIPAYDAERQTFIDKLDEAMVEDGSVARATLISGKFQVESPEDEPKVVKGEPEWQIEEQARIEDSSERSK